MKPGVVAEHLRKSTEQQGASQAVIAAILNMDSCVDILLCSCMALMNLTADSECHTLQHMASRVKGWPHLTGVSHISINHPASCLS